MPSWELFEDQTAEYKNSVFLPGVPVISIEVPLKLLFLKNRTEKKLIEFLSYFSQAGSTLGWDRYAHASIGVDRFGVSGPYKDVRGSLPF